MPGYNSPRRGTARTVPMYFCGVLCIAFFCSMYFLCHSMYFFFYVLFCVVLCIVFVLFYVLFVCCSMYCLFFVVLCIVCKCVLYYCHRVSTELQLTNISYHIISTCLSAVLFRMSHIFFLSPVKPM
jgi:hypothetical protein